MSKTVKVGMMPGKIHEFIVETGTTVADVIKLADLNSMGYEVKVDNVKIEDPSETLIEDSTNLVLLVKQVKGN